MKACMGKCLCVAGRAPGKQTAANAFALAHAALAALHGFAAAPVAAATARDCLALALRSLPAGADPLAELRAALGMP